MGRMRIEYSPQVGEDFALLSTVCEKEIPHLLVCYLFLVPQINNPAFFCNPPMAPSHCQNTNTSFITYVQSTDKKTH